MNQIEPEENLDHLNFAGGDDEDEIDADYIYPNAKRLMDIAASMNHYETQLLDSKGLNNVLDVKDTGDIAEKYNAAVLMCEEFAKLEQVTKDPGLIMMMYEGIIFKTTWDLRLQTQSKRRYKELARFFMAGCVVMLGLSIYLLSKN